MSQDAPAPMHLSEDEDSGAGIAGLVERFGAPVGLSGVLTSLNRRAERSEASGRLVEWAFRWAPADEGSQRWWPQGISCSGDATPDGLVEGRRILVTSWYSKEIDGEDHGSRITVVDPDTLAYRHVLLVRPAESFGETVLRPLSTHAGGLAWCGDWLHIAGTFRGLYCCRPDDILEVDPGPESFGHRFVLPVRNDLAAQTAPQGRPMRYSFVSVDRGAAQLVTGEYGAQEGPHRLVRYPLDLETGRLRTADGTCRPDDVHDTGPAHTQGAVVVDGTWYLTTSHGRHRHGQLHHGEPGALGTTRRALPAGPEDLTHDPAARRLWSLTEYPGRRWVVCLDPGRVSPR